LLVIWLQLNVSGSRPVLARGWHKARPSMRTIGNGLMKVVCAGGQVDDSDLESAEANSVAALWCCIVCPAPARVTVAYVPLSDTLSQCNMMGA
jgi:hypothetical protein